MEERLSALERDNVQLKASMSALMDPQALQQQLDAAKMKAHSDVGLEILVIGEKGVPRVGREAVAAGRLGKLVVEDLQVLWENLPSILSQL